MADREADWKQKLLADLRSRNRRQTYCFVGLIHAHNKLFESTNSLKARNVQLTIETEKLKEESLHVRADGGGGGGSSERVQALEQKVYKLQEELTALHRKRGENAQQIIDLNKALQEKEMEIQLKDSKLGDMNVDMLAFKTNIKHLKQTIMELEATNQMLKDEHQALGLVYTALEEKYRKVQEDNVDLVARWMELKSRDADRINEDNDVFLRKRQDKLRKDLAEAAKENITIKPESETGVRLPGFSGMCMSASIPTRAQFKFDAHDGEVNAIKWSLSGNLFATGGADRKLKLWDVKNGKCEPKGILLGSNAGITSLEFDFEDKFILGASNDFASRVWSLSDQRLRHTLTGHSGKVLAAKFLGDSSKVVSGSHDRTLKVWDLVSRSCIKTIFAGSSCNDLVTLQGTNIISGHFDKRLRFWDSRIENSTNEIGLQGRITSLDLSPDRSTLLTCTRDDTIKIIDLRMNQVSGTLCDDGFKVGSDWTRATFSPDGTYAVAGSQDGTVFIWDSSSGKVESRLKEHGHCVMACSWHPRGSSILTCEKQKKAILWADF